MLRMDIGNPVCKHCHRFDQIALPVLDKNELNCKNYLCLKHELFNLELDFSWV